MSVSESLSSDNSDNENFPNDFIENILDSESRRPKGRPPDTARFKGPLENNVNKTRKCGLCNESGLHIDASSEGESSSHKKTQNRKGVKLKHTKENGVKNLKNPRRSAELLEPNTKQFCVKSF
ncbi:10403_t:CDS:2 [Funneliformis caledonium]|uniref:10403_t:CDS:1 n=1 Tax=Funneliformis caledonium TaxID=1117310 RepID=A0A9N8YL75_9GLOM|nr:10403_t:CDS:2 [Funneliformis caledonium]